MTRPPVRSASPSFLHSDRVLARAAQPVVRFLHIEAAGGILLVAATVVALVWANSPWQDSYDSLWSTTIGIDIGSYRFEEDLAHVVNDLFMALFFFVVGMEIKRELVVGELRDRRAVALPAMAALGGMVVPAVIYAAFNAGGDGAAGWGIPMATDIAFALGIVALLGTRVPTAVKVLLLTLAIVDDIGAIAVIAIFYSDGLRPAMLPVAAAIAALVAMMHRAQVIYAPLIVLASIGLWFVVYESGVHATIAGVVLGLLTPARPAADRARSRRDRGPPREPQRPASRRGPGHGPPDRRIGVSLRPVDRRPAPVDELRHRARVRAGQRRHPTVRRRLHRSLRRARRRRGRARGGQTRRHHGIQLARGAPRARASPRRRRLAPHRRRRRRCWDRLHGVAVHHWTGLRHRHPAGRRQDRHPHRLDQRRHHRRHHLPPRRPTTAALTACRPGRTWSRRITMTHVQRTSARHHEDMAGWRQVKRAVFARHCNPWSAWTRWASAPLVLVPVWRRSWRDAALVGVWMAVNPMVFGKPAHERAWATRAVLGEEQWIEDRPMDAAMAVNVGASVAGVAAMIAARKRRAAPAAVSMATLMALLLWYWELMARYHDERGDR